ncbi:MAG: ribosomal-protein-alanine N-acetyltransferase [Maribacter sp.]|jgi:hypothetical protein
MKIQKSYFQNKWKRHLISIIHIANLPLQQLIIKNGMERYQTTPYKNALEHIYRINN